jgi:HD-like signal output (HDOD) protein
MDGARQRTGQHRQEGYGRGIVVIDSAVGLDSDEIVRELRATFGSPSYAPPMLPAVALEVQRLVKQPDIGLMDVVKVIETDALLAADVLRVAQSPIFATRIPPKSIQDAASRLGLNGLRDVVWQAAMSGRVFRVKAYEKPMRALRRHALASGTVTRLVASKTSVSMEYGFLAGLLHDVGLAACFIAFGERRRPPTVEDIALPLQALHHEAGEVVAKLWGLPQELQWVIGHHSHPTIQGYDHPLISCLVLAHRCCEDLGYGVTLQQGACFDGVSDHAIRVSMRTLGLDDLDAIRAEAAQTLEKM